ncbi:major tail tube protein [Escherichia coli]|nr:major tail tube protein [Escherichia coli]
MGKVTSVTPPKLTRKTDSYRGGGMMGAVSIDLGLDDSALDASFVMGGAVRALFLKYGGTMTARCCVLRVNITPMQKAICMKSRCAGV